MFTSVVKSVVAIAIVIARLAFFVSLSFRLVNSLCQFWKQE
jgi:hypothetical protein